MESFLLFTVSFINAIALDQPNIELIRRSLKGDVWGAAGIGIGATFGDTFYFVLMLTGLARVATEPSIRLFIGTIGCLLFIVTGLRRLFPPEHTNNHSNVLLITSNPALFGFILTMFNPSSTIGTLVILEFVEVSSITDLSRVFLIYFLSAASCIVLLIGFFRFCRRFLTASALLLVDRLSGWSFIIMGFVTLWLGSNNI